MRNFHFHIVAAMSCILLNSTAQATPSSAEWIRINLELDSLEPQAGNPKKYSHDMQKFNAFCAKQIEDYLIDGGDIHTKTKDALTPLHKAVDCRSFSMVETLLQMGADINALDHYQKPPLTL
ncbi:MAG: hypothetical protein NW237_16260 [Cyanobacteriota bacterium]|nr:hypothetical protein [Cyanobacteriota bacterium]